MVYYKSAVVVGSILHDAACRNPEGVYCRGIKRDLWRELPLVKNGNFPATREWNKAVYNTHDDRGWVGKFGPYPADDALEKTYSDDMREARYNRMTYMADVAVFGIFTAPSPSISYTAGEKRATLRLEAPAGTNLDWRDQEFCASDTSSYVKRAGLTEAWITCE